MSTYRVVKTNMWRDGWFGDLEPIEMCVFMYLFSSPDGNACGAYKTTPKVIGGDTNIDRSQIPAILQRLCQPGSDGRVRVSWWPELEMVFVHNFYEHNKSNPKFELAAARAADQLPEPVRVAVFDRYPNFAVALEAAASRRKPSKDQNTVSEPLQYGIDTVSEPYADGIDTDTVRARARSEAGAVTEAGADKRTKTGPSSRASNSAREEAAVPAHPPAAPSRFTPPTREQVRAHFKALEQLQDEADLFFAHYENERWSGVTSWAYKAEEWILRGKRQFNRGSPRHAAGSPPSQGGTLDEQRNEMRRMREALETRGTP